MTQLSEKDVKGLQSGLETERERLRETLHDKLLRSGDQDTVEMAGQVRDSGDDSIAELLIGLNTTSMENDVREIRDIEDSLARIASGEYGVCIECAGPIPLARLQAYPTAKRCIECQMRYEDRRGGRDATPSL